MHRLSIRTFTCNWVFTKTQYAAGTLGAKGCVDLSLLTSMRIKFSKSVSGQLLCKRARALPTRFGEARA